jgi:hypothetical protein
VECATYAEAERICAMNLGPFLLRVLVEHGHMIGITEEQQSALRIAFPAD